LEIANKIETVLLDKTGTLTSGNPVVTRMEWCASATESDMRVLRQMESRSNHPLARSIAEHLDSKTQENATVEQEFDHFEEIPGKGIIASCGSTGWMVGNPSFLKENGIPVNLMESARVPGSTVVGFCSKDKLLATIEIADELKPEASSAVSKFRNLGIEAVLVSGDSEEAAGKAARDTGIKIVYANTLPEEKGKLVGEIQKAGKKVAMIGDGINDAYALSRADLGIAMGHGTDIAIESAGIVLMRSDLMHAVAAIQLSKKVVRTIRQNLFWAFFYNLMAIPVAAGLIYPFTGILLDPMIAGATMALSSITVVGNSLRINRIKLSEKA